MNEILIAELTKRLDALERRVQELELKNTCFGPIVDRYPNGPPSVTFTGGGTGASMDIPKGSVSIPCFSEPSADKPKREWWCLQYRNGEIHSCPSERSARQHAAEIEGCSVVNAIPAPTDAEIEAAVRKTVDVVPGLCSAETVSRLAIRHLLGRAEK